MGERGNAFLRTLRVVRFHELLRSTLKSYIGIGFAFGYGATGLGFRNLNVGSLLWVGCLCSDCNSSAQDSTEDIGGELHVEGDDF